MGAQEDIAPLESMTAPAGVPVQTYKVLKGSAGVNVPEPVGFLYSADNFPNPFREPKKCVLFRNVPHSWICDPERLLSPNEQAVVESRLLKLRDSTSHRCRDGKIHPYQMAVAV